MKKLSKLRHQQGENYVVFWGRRQRLTNAISPGKRAGFGRSVLISDPKRKPRIRSADVNQQSLDLLTRGLVDDNVVFWGRSFHKETCHVREYPAVQYAESVSAFRIIEDLKSAHFVRELDGKLFIAQFVESKEATCSAEFQCIRNLFGCNCFEDILFPGLVVVEIIR
jgi:hypothetical protein